VIETIDHLASSSYLPMLYIHQTSRPVLTLGFCVDDGNQTDNNNVNRCHLIPVDSCDARCLSMSQLKLEPTEIINEWSESSVRTVNGNCSYEIEL